MPEEIIDPIPMESNHSNDD